MTAVTIADVMRPFVISEPAIDSRLEDYIRLCASQLEIIRGQDADIIQLKADLARCVKREQRHISNLRRCLAEARGELSETAPRRRKP